MLKLIRNAVIALGLLFSTSGQVFAESSPGLDRVIEKGVLRVGMTGDQPPLNALSRSKEVIGFEVDLARALGSAMGVNVEFVTMNFGELLSALDDHRVDIVMSGVAITPARAQKYRFVGPYMVSGKSILTTSIALTRATESSDINRGDLKLAALSGSTSEDFIKKFAPEAEFVPVDKYDEAIALVKNDSIDALVADMPICILAVLRDPDAGLATARRPLTIEPLGIAVRSGDEALARLLSQYLETYERMGLLDKLQVSWMQDQSWIARLP